MQSLTCLMAASLLVASLQGASAKDGDGPNTWTAPGITSSTIPLDPAHLSLALADNADLHYSSFHGQPTDDNSLLITPALLGAATLDNKVDALDLNQLAAHWQQASGALWSAGDFTHDGNVDALDLNLLAAHWQSGAGATLYAFPSSFPPAGSVPEPASLFLQIPGFLLLARRRCAPSCFSFSLGRPLRRPQ